MATRYGRIVANNGTNLTLSLSGADVQIAHTAAGAKTINWSYLYITIN